GPSGSGKSSLLYILGGLEPPSSGTVTLDGKNPFQLDATGLATFRNKEIGFVFQDHCLLPQCTVLENVLVPTLLKPDREDVSRARALVERVGLADRIDHRPAALSGGERQRVAMARSRSGFPRASPWSTPGCSGHDFSAAGDGGAAPLLADEPCRHRRRRHRG